MDGGSPLLGGIDIARHDDKRCVAVWQHIRLRDPARLHEIVKQLLAPTPVVIKSSAESSHLSVLPRICSLNIDLQRRWLALMHLPGLTSNQIKNVVSSMGPHVSDPMTSSILESLARLHRIPYFSQCVDFLSNPIKTQFPSCRDDDKATTAKEPLFSDIVPEMAIDILEKEDTSMLEEKRLDSLPADLQLHLDQLLAFLENPTSSQPSIEWLQNSSNEVAEFVFRQLDLKSRQSAALDVFVRAFADVSVRYDLLCLFYRSSLVPLLASLETPASRQLFTLLQDLAAAHPRALLHGLMCPLLQLPLKNPQVELFNRIGKEPLSSSDRLVIIQHCVELQAWSDEIIKIVQSLLSYGAGPVSDSIAAALVSKIQLVSTDSDLCKSSKFPGLIITVAGKYTSSFLPWKTALLNACELLPGFMKKVALKSVQNMAAAS